MTDLTEPDPDALAAAAAAWIVDAFGAIPGRIAISLAGGSTPKRLYEQLATQRLPWDRTHWFWGDERFVPPDDPRSNQAMIRAALLDHVPVPPANIHPVPTTGLSPEDAARAYDATLRALAAQDPHRPLFDLVLLGLGANGHTASLFPGEPVLGERTAWAAPVTPPGEPTRITLTYPALENTRHAAFIVTGADKAPVIRAVRSGDTALPATHYHPAHPVMWWLDQAAA